MPRKAHRQCLGDELEREEGGEGPLYELIRWWR